MGGCRTPQRALLLGALLFACACNFSVAGFDSLDTPDGGKTPPGMMHPPPDLGASPDLATPPSPPDLSQAPDLLPLPDKVGDACAGSCGAALTCMTWVPNGYCSETCDGSANSCPPGSTCVDTGGGGGGAGTRYCLVNANGGGNCMRPDLQCRDCTAKVCGPSNFCDGC